MRLLPFLIVFLAGCAAPAAQVHTGTGTQESFVAEPEVPVRGGVPVEAGGANVTWLGTGSTSFDVEVPNGSADLAFVYWTRTIGQGTVPGNSVAYGDFTVRLDGCPDGTGGGYGTGSHIGGGHVFCEAPPAGRHHATVTLEKGYQDGRVCIVAREKNPSTFGDCRFSPFHRPSASASGR